LLGEIKFNSIGLGQFATNTYLEGYRPLFIRVFLFHGNRRTLKTSVQVIIHPHGSVVVNTETNIPDTFACTSFNICQEDYPARCSSDPTYFFCERKAYVDIPPTPVFVLESTAYTPSSKSGTSGRIETNKRDYW
jgi:hypothetical protein